MIIMQIFMVSGIVVFRYLLCLLTESYDKVISRIQRPFRHAPVSSCAVMSLSPRSMVYSAIRRRPAEMSKLQASKHQKPSGVKTRTLIRRRDSEREVLRSAPRKLPKFAEITQNNGHYAVQGHSRSPILAPIESSYTISY